MPVCELRDARYKSSADRSKLDTRDDLCELQSLCRPGILPDAEAAQAMPRIESDAIRMQLLKVDDACLSTVSCPGHARYLYRGSGIG